MARLVGVDLPREKRLEVALQYIFGIGETRAKATLLATGVSLISELKIYKNPISSSFVNISKLITRSKVISAVRLHQIFDAKLISSATKEFATAKGYLFAVSAHIPMHVPVRGHALQLLVRRRRPSNGRP